MIDYSTVKSFILHPERCVREFVAEFFAESNIGDADVAQLLLDAYERGVEQGEGWGILRNVSVLPQTEATLQRLQRIDASDYNTIAHIDNAIVESGLELLRKFPDIRPKLPRNISILDNRFRLAAMKTEKLWEELWRHSESGMGHNLEEFDYEYGGLIVKELSARQDFPVDKYLERIQMVYPEDYSGWDEAYLCALSGELRSEESLPFLIRTVKIDGDFVPERASEALAKIGTASVVEAIGREYLNEEIPFRIHATGALGNIKTEASENLMLELLPKEKDITQKTSLGFGLCKLFSTKGIPMALTLLRYGYDTMMVNLEEAVYVNHVVNGLEHPDMKKWRESIERDEERMRGARNALSVGNISMDQMKNGFENLFKRMNETKKLNELYSKGFKVGRNDPCPCGSGKKYKKCCGK